MFEIFSERARGIILAARIKAGRRGAATIGGTDLLFAIVMEDDEQKFGTYLQGSFGDGTGAIMSFGSHAQFLGPAIAAELLAKLESTVEEGEPITDSVDMPLAPEALQTLQRAGELREEMGHRDVEPLHLLAAIFIVPHIAEMVKSSGITEEKVRERLQEEAN